MKKFTNTIMQLFKLEKRLLKRLNKVSFLNNPLKVLMMNTDLHIREVKVWIKVKGLS